MTVLKIKVFNRHKGDSVMANNKFIGYLKKIPEAVKGKQGVWKWLIVIFVLASALVGLIFYGNILAFMLLFGTFSHKVATLFGIDIWLAKIITLITGLVLISFVSPMVFSLNRKRRFRGYWVGAVIFIILFIGAYAFNRDTVFSSDGSASKCVALNPITDTYEYVPCSWKVHPKFGTITKPATKELIIQKITKENGPGEFTRVAFHKNLRLFASDETPLVWYYQYPDGKLELFSNPGVHPQLGVVLSAINPKIAVLLNKYLDEGKYAMIIVDGYAYGNSQHAITATDGNGLKELRDFLNTVRR